MNNFFWVKQIKQNLKFLGETFGARNQFHKFSVLAFKQHDSCVILNLRNKMLIAAANISQ